MLGSEKEKIIKPYFQKFHTSFQYHHLSEYVQKHQEKENTTKHSNKQLRNTEQN